MSNETLNRITDRVRDELQRRTSIYLHGDVAPSKYLEFMDADPSREQIALLYRADLVTRLEESLTEHLGFATHAERAVLGVFIDTNVVGGRPMLRVDPACVSDGELLAVHVTGEGWFAEGADARRAISRLIRDNTSKKRNRKQIDDFVRRLCLPLDIDPKMCAKILAREGVESLTVMVYDALRQISRGASTHIDANVIYDDPIRLNLTDGDMAVIARVARGKRDRGSSDVL